VDATDTFVVVCDTGPLIHLDELDALDVLRDFQHILVPQTVWSEVERHRPSAVPKAGMPLTHVESGPEPDASFVTLAQAFSLDAGEREALLVARERPSAWLASDDAAARLAAELLGIRAHGTIGLLIRVIRRGRRAPAAVITLIEQLPARSSLHVRLALLREVLDRLRREFRIA
jgi:predicted nucleic acid-binding protein